MNIEDTITSDDVLGKDVIDSDGDFIGVVEKLHLDPRTLDVVGISVDKGFLRRGLFIGKGYVRRITSHAVFLSVRPAFSIRGMTVFDATGRKVGVAVDVRLYASKNRIRSIIVRSGLFRSPLEIPGELIASIGENVFLKEKKEDLRTGQQRPGLQGA